MSEVNQALADLLRRYLSPINAQSILERAVRDVGAEKGAPPSVQDLVPRLERSAKLFCSPRDFEKLTSELRSMGTGQRSSSRRTRVEISREKDIVDALLATRGLCKEAGARPLMQQRASTVVSELSRNIVAYTPGGTLEIEVKGMPPRLAIRAADRGSGIPNLNEILGGRYRSKTGLGRGLLGTKQLAEHFNVETSSSGTIIEVEMSL